MTSSPQSDTRTRMFARVIGPYLVLVMATAVGRFSDLRSMIADFDPNSAWPWFGGALVLLSGLVVIALHPYWRGIPAILVSLMGWSTALKGFALMALPHTYFTFAKSWIDVTPLWIAAYVFVGLIGIYLTYVGWGPASSRRAPHAAIRIGRLRPAA